MAVDELILPEGDWRQMAGLKLDKKVSTRVKVGVLNAVPTMGGGLHRWLHRGDLLRLLYSEAERLDSPDLKLLTDRIAETTHKET